MPSTVPGMGIVITNFSRQFRAITVSCQLCMHEIIPAIHTVTYVRLYGYDVEPSRYPDFVSTASGLQYKDFREGTGEQPKAGGEGGVARSRFTPCIISFGIGFSLALSQLDHCCYSDTVVIDWDGYTIGYYGRPFEARNKVGTIDCFPCSQILDTVSICVTLFDTCSPAIPLTTPGLLAC